MLRGKREGNGEGSVEMREVFRDGDAVTQKSKRKSDLNNWDSVAARGTATSSGS